MIALDAVLQGVSIAETGLNRAAVRIAQSTATLSQNDLGADVVELLQSRNDLQANLKIVKTVDEVTKSSLDLFA